MPEGQLALPLSVQNELLTQDEREVADLESLWCSCRQPQGDRFIIECDHEGDKCYHWYHGNCVGVTPAEGRRLESQGEPFICPFCTIVPSLLSFNSVTAPDFTWGSSVNGSDFCDQIQKAYESILFIGNTISFWSCLAVWALNL